MQKLLFLVPLATMLSACHHNSVLPGTDIEYSVAGGVNDSDASTQRNGSYQGLKNGSHTDGLSTAKSEIKTFKRLNGVVEIALDPNGTGPWTGLPNAIAGQKVKSTFRLDKSTRVKFILALEVTANIRGSGEGILEMLVSVHNAVSASGIVNASISTVHYSLKEDPNDEDMIILVRNGPQGATDTSVMDDNSILIDVSPEPPPFNLPAGDYVAIFELNVKGTGDADYTYVWAETDFDLVRAN